MTHKVIGTVNGIDFWYGGWNENGWHLVFTDHDNFHVGDKRDVMPTQKDLETIYRNYYED